MEVGDLDLGQVTPDLLRAWKLDLLQRYKSTTVRKYLARLHCALAFAVDCGWLESNPLARIRQPSEGRGRVRYLEAEERRRLLAACQQSRNPHLYAIVVTALSTGGRRDEIRCLRWTDVDFAQSVVRFVQTKTDVDRAVPLVGEAHHLLKERHLHRQLNVPWVFPRQHGTGPTPIESPWITARRRAKIEDFHFHDLRHTYASYLAMSGASLREIADLLGHRNIQQTTVYTHLMPSHTQKVVQQMLTKLLAPRPPEP